MKVKRHARSRTADVDYAMLAEAEQIMANRYPDADRVKALPTSGEVPCVVEVWQDGRADVMRV